MKVNMNVSEGFIYVEKEDGEMIAEFEILEDNSLLEDTVTSLIEGLGHQVNKEYI